MPINTNIVSMALLGYLNNKETKQIYVDKDKSPIYQKDI